MAVEHWTFLLLQITSVAVGIITLIAAVLSFASVGWTAVKRAHTQPSTAAGGGTDHNSPSRSDPGGELVFGQNRGWL